MQESITLAPPNSLILIMDYDFGELPEDIGNQLIAFTDSCVAVGTLSEVDGNTTITLTDDQEHGKHGEMFFEGTLKIPSHELSICSTDNVQLLAMQLSKPEIKIKIIANDASEPDNIIVLVGPE